MQIIFNTYLSFAVTDWHGELAALAAACLWSVASTIYGVLGRSIGPMQLNLIKGIIAIALLLLTILISGEFAPNLPFLPVCLLFLSGAVGIGWGDTAFLAAINYLGARQVLLLGTLSPPMTAIAATIFLQERLNVSAWCGILLTILGVAWVVTERVPDSSEVDSTHLWQGIGFGLLAAITNTAGSIFSRAAFATASINPLWAALLRLIAGVLTILLWVWLSPRQQRTIFAPFWQSRRVILTSFFAAFCGTFLGIWLQQTAIKFTSVGIASTLLQTSPLFVIPIAIGMGEKVSLRAIVGVGIAIAGIGLLFYLK